jgi:hypothetical protein
VVPENIWRYIRGVIWIDVVITGFRSIFIYRDCERWVLHSELTRRKVTYFSLKISLPIYFESFWWVALFETQELSIAQSVYWLHCGLRNRRIVAQRSPTSRPALEPTHLPFQRVSEGSLTESKATGSHKLITHFRVTLTLRINGAIPPLH